MPETSKGSKKEKGRRTKPVAGEDLTDDQKERPYYYDDACGYTVYEPDDEDENDLTEEESA